MTPGGQKQWINTEIQATNLISMDLLLNIRMEIEGYIVINPWPPGIALAYELICKKNIIEL
jgi:hypothetical protein